MVNIKLIIFSAVIVMGILGVISYYKLEFKWKVWLFFIIMIIVLYALAKWVQYLYKGEETEDEY